MERGGGGRGKEKKNGNIPTVWFSLKKSLHCKPEPSDVYDPRSSRSNKHENHHHLGAIATRKAGRSGCSRSIANLKDVVHGSKRHIEKPASNNSPRSIGSSEFLNPIVHEVIFNNSTCELKITGFDGCVSDGSCGGGGATLPVGTGGSGAFGSGSAFVGTLRPGTPGPRSHPSMHYFNPSVRNASPTTPHRKSPNLPSDKEGFGLGGPVSVSIGGGGGGGGGVVRSKHRNSLEADVNGSSNATCHKCGEHFVKWEALEAHHLTKHAVTELVEGDSSRKIVEIICRASWLKSENLCGKIERVLKVHNMQKTIAWFEEYREMVKIKASKLPKKHPRCLADGNELLRFHGTTVACSLGLNGSSSLCASEKCCVCQIIRHGFSTRKEIKGGIGVFTTSTSGRAFENIEIFGNDSTIRKALIICRVIAGRVHKPLENVQEMVDLTGFDSLAGKVSVYSNIEELYLLNTRALLPCFVVTCQP